MPKFFADLLKQVTADIPAPGGTADVASAMSLIFDVLQKIAEGDRPEEYVPAIRATLVGLRKDTAAQCAQFADSVDDLSGVGLGIKERFGLLD
jgi:hypothetical protein